MIKYLLNAALLLGFYLIHAQDDIRVRFNGFGDITLGHNFGGAAEKAADTLFQQFGEDPYPKGTNQGIGLQGLDLVNTVFIHENITIQSEINLQVPRGNTGGPELDVERMYMDYKVSDKLGLQGGLFFTPIGFINRNLYSRAWLMNSVHLFRSVEEETGYVPNHFIGINAYGTFNLSEKFSIKYITGLGNARGEAPVDNLYARSFDGYQLTGLLEGIIQGPKDLRIGVSGYVNEHPTYKGLDQYGAIVAAVDSNRYFMQETGFIPYIHYSGKRFELLAEYTLGTYSASGKISNTNMLVAEIAINTYVNEKRLAPYIRYDYIRTPTYGGPYIGNRDLGSGFYGKVYEPNLSSLMAGICYDLTSFNRIKLEYGTHFVGPFIKNSIVFQTAFGF